MKPRWLLHVLGVALFAALVCALFLREPGFGDDFTYWSFAFSLHEEGAAAWSKASFHQLRWPVWGVSWVLQGLLGPGLLSFYGVPLFYLAAGAILAFTFGRLITTSVWIAWGCAIAWLFHPLLDTVCYRPMPDLSEGVLGAAAVLVWWMLTRAAQRGTAAGWAILLGTIIYVVESNRLTGVFIVPVLIVSTLLWARRSFGWLVFAGVVSAALYVGEAAIYHQIFGDWLHNLHANMGGKGRKGTETIALWSLPFRFIDTLWKGNPLAPAYFILATIGAWFAWSGALRRQTLGPDPMTTGSAVSELRPAPPLERVMVVWMVLLYLEYACAPQSIWPWRPLLRDADRFLCGLTVPMSVLATLGACGLLRSAWLRQYRWGRAVAERPVIAALAVSVLCVAVTSRDRASFGSIPEMRQYLRSRPEGSTVFTHNLMRSFAFLIDPQSARRFKWLVKAQILHRKPELEAMAAKADEFWYIRKLVWLTTRKKLENKGVEDQQQLGSYFESPERDWRMTRLLAKGDTPDLVFYTRRKADDPAPRILNASAPEFSGIFPTLPYERKGGDKNVSMETRWTVPDSLKGQLCRVEIEAASDEVQGFTARLQFFTGKRMSAEYLLKPYLHPHPAMEFFAFQIPPDADQCRVELKIEKGVKTLQLTGFKALFEAPRE